MIRTLKNRVVFRSVRSSVHCIFLNDKKVLKYDTFLNRSDACQYLHSKTPNSNQLLTQLDWCHLSKGVNGVLIGQVVFALQEWGWLKQPINDAREVGQCAATYLPVYVYCLNFRVTITASDDGCSLVWLLKRDVTFKEGKNNLENLICRKHETR